MRYDKLGNPMLHKLGRGASFAEVYLTAVELGYTVESKGLEYVKFERTTGFDQPGWPITETKHIKPEEAVEFLNQRLLDEGIIKEEVEL